MQGDIIAYGTQSSKNASVNLTTNAALAYQGDALAANGGIVDVKLGNCSSWAGRADDYQDATNSEWLKNHTDNLDTKFSGRVTGSGTVKIDMGTGSFWNVTGQSWVTDLKGNNSYIILDNDENGNGYALHIGKITGKNTLAMNISPEDNGNMIYVKDGTGAQQNLIINNRDEVLQNMDVGDAVRFATVANAGMGFEMVNLLICRCKLLAEAHVLAIPVFLTWILTLYIMIMNKICKVMPPIRKKIIMAIVLIKINLAVTM